MIGRGHAPGRVNLIGEHIDYNGGTVLPAALSVGVSVELEPRSDTQMRLGTDQYETTAMRDMSEDAKGDWTDPSLGALREAKALGLLEGGANLAIRSTIPQGAGLSSSAALIVAILKAARDAATGATASDADIAIAARRVENNYLGVPCGIMDQFAVAIAKPGMAMALDTASLAYELVELPQDHRFVVLHSGVSRKLTDGRYKTRKEECDAAKAHFDTDNLCALDPAKIATSNLAEPIRRRAMHCASEHRRALASVEALKSGDMAHFGVLMNESHASMRDDFEVSLEAIDALVATALREGAIGARLTGGGFGGCIVALVHNEAKDKWCATVLRQHPKARLICEA
ncbi:galactokinase [Erythrobacter sp. SCSIO 43205]|uniref:galactokinase n=1 Tax=Erythrobacter sp. SCSIO 43205 TaxID=2779361 RepID=UPI001CA9B87E|nr:galactokinase [Erythrobacter sp. SCSIO 43205]UAB77873.1 galactokinase [Erythrobacter sp. SCSIO 43205]